MAEGLFATLGICRRAGWAGHIVRSCVVGEGILGLRYLVHDIWVSFRRETE
jgi:hypothetical protein